MCMSLKLETKILIVLFMVFLGLHMTNDYVYVDPDANFSEEEYRQYPQTDVGADYIVRQIHSKNSTSILETENITPLDDLLYQEELERKNRDFEDLYVKVVILNKSE